MADQSILRVRRGGIRQTITTIGVVVAGISLASIAVSLMPIAQQAKLWNKCVAQRYQTLSSSGVETASAIGDPHWWAVSTCNGH
jgi:hypothetical protein